MPLRIASHPILRGLRCPQGISFCFVLLAAYFSTGYFWPDEHFQLLEFVSFKLGRTPSSDLAWEFHERVRPWFQPSIYYALVRLFEALSIANPAVHAFLFRLLSGLIGWASLFFFLGEAGRRWLDEKDTQRARWLAALLFCFPFLLVRLSSETLGASLLLCSLGLYLRSRRDPEHPSSRLDLWSGVVLAVAIVTRYQVGLFALGFVAWRLAFDRRTATAFLLGFAAPLAVAPFLDRWGYGEFTFPAWNYVVKCLYLASGNPENPLWKSLGATIATAHKLPFVSKSPWYGYLLLGGPVTLAFHALLFAFWWRFRTNVVTWVTVPYYLVHCLVAHKELRYLFPLLYFLPLQLPMTLRGAHVGKIYFWEKLCDGIRRPWGRVVVTMNLIVLLVLCLKPLQTDIVLQELIVGRFPVSFEGFYVGSNPFRFHSLGMRFFSPPQLKLTELTGAAAIEAAREQARSDVHVIAEKPLSEISSECATVLQVIPKWVESWDRGKLLSRTRHWRVYRCPPRERTESRVSSVDATGPRG